MKLCRKNKSYKTKAKSQQSLASHKPNKIKVSSSQAESSQSSSNKKAELVTVPLDITEVQEIHRQTLKNIDILRAADPHNSAKYFDINIVHNPIKKVESDMPMIKKIDHLNDIIKDIEGTLSKFDNSSDAALREALLRKINRENLSQSP